MQRLVKAFVREPAVHNTRSPASTRDTVSNGLVHYKIKEIIICMYERILFTFFFLLLDYISKALLTCIPSMFSGQEHACR